MGRAEVGQQQQQQHSLLHLLGKEMGGASGGQQ